MAQPFCEHCQAHGRMTTAATEVHHRTPVDARSGTHEKRQLMFGWSNLMSVCRSCHRELHARLGSNKPGTMARRQADAALQHFAATFRMGTGNEKE